jgi:hypothetical protein
MSQALFIMYQRQHLKIYRLPSKIDRFKVIKVFHNIMTITECELHIEMSPL